MVVVWFGGRAAQTDYTAAYLDVAEFAYSDDLKNTVLDITNAYYTLLAQKAVLKVPRIRRIIPKSYQDAQKRFDVGLVPLNDVLLTKTAYEQSKLVVIQSKNAVLEASGAGNFAEFITRCCIRFGAPKTIGKND